MRPDKERETLGKKLLLRSDLSPHSHTAELHGASATSKGQKFQLLHSEDGHPRATAWNTAQQDKHFWFSNGREYHHLQQQHRSSIRNKQECLQMFSKVYYQGVCFILFCKCNGLPVLLVNQYIFLHISVTYYSQTKTPSFCLVHVHTRLKVSFQHIRIIQYYLIFKNKEL